MDLNEFLRLITPDVTAIMKALDDELVSQEQLLNSERLRIHEMTGLLERQSRDSSLSLKDQEAARTIAVEAARREARQELQEVG